MIRREKYTELKDLLDTFPAVTLLEPRQAGKTTLALEIAKDFISVYLDLESEEDRAKLASPAYYLESHKDKLVILDEVHRIPGIFQELRGIIDKIEEREKRWLAVLHTENCHPSQCQNIQRTLINEVVACNKLKFHSEFVSRTTHSRNNGTWLTYRPYSR